MSDTEDLRAKWLAYDARLQEDDSGGSLSGAAYIIARSGVSDDYNPKIEPERGGQVIVLIPAHNEARSIERTVASIAAQSVPVGRVYVIADRCTDRTAELARKRGAAVMESVDNFDMKAGALNQGLRTLLPVLEPTDSVLIMDADSVLVPGFIEQALRELNHHPSAGAVCATFAAESDRRGLVHVAQRAEYARFARSVSRRGARAQVLSGVATLFPVTTLREIQEARQTGELPPAPGIYDVTAATEDIEMTYAVRKLGYRPTAPRGCLAYTDTMPSWHALAMQRVRWQRGMLDAIRLYGVNRGTAPAIVRLAWMYFSSIALLLLLVLLGTAAAVQHGIVYRPWWLLILPVFAFERWWTVRHLGWREQLMAALLVPEWCYDNYRAVIYWVALVGWLRHTDRVWIPT